jgi:protein-tyrosine phosphatase
MGIGSVVKHLPWGRPEPEAEFAVLMVCMGNICRSPTAEAALRQRLSQVGLAHRVRVDSAGTHSYHVGSSPDQRAQAHGRRRGLELSGLKARKIAPDDFGRFDLILAMDQENLADLLRMAPPGYESRVKLLMNFARSPHGVDSVPDPYYGSEAGFERVLDLVGDACEGLTGVLLRMLGPSNPPQTRPVHGTS